MTESGERGNVVPRSIESERTLLGGLMLDPRRIQDVEEVVQAADFYLDHHQRLFELMTKMAASNKPVEMIAVIEEIVRRGDGTGEEFGGVGYVSGLPDHVPSTENILHYARTVRDRALERRVVDGARAILDQTFAGEQDVNGLLEFAESTIFQLRGNDRGGEWKGMSEVVDQEFMRIQELRPSEGGITGIPTGLIDLDKMLAGLHRTDLLILAARPAMGKTALALNIAKAVALQGHGVGVFSMEMSAGQLVTRMLVSEARVDAGKVRTGRLSVEHDWPRLRDAADQLYRIPLYIDDSPGQTIAQVRSKARRLAVQHPGLALIVVDYIGLMSGDPKVSRQEQISAASRGMKGLAKELNVTVLCLSQLNRGVETRNPQIPVMADLRESGAIEQDADVIMFIYREEYYNKDAPTRPGEADVIIAKQRNGSTGTVALSFQGEFTLFGNLARSSDGGSYL